MQVKKYFHEQVAEMASFDNLTIQLILAVSFPQEPTEAAPTLPERYIERYSSSGIIPKKLYKLF